MVSHTNRLAPQRNLLIPANIFIIMLNLWKEALIGLLLIESFGSAIALPPRPLMARSDEVSAKSHHVKQRDNLSPYAGLFIRDDDDDDRE